ncbi:MAG: type II toxin-antitoxin system HicB family antitoxin [Hydrogenophaga sp.]|nr:type II toxin-antitoxin system HicB family antitoxin [Hydrogenophaga sp.]
MDGIENWDLLLVLGVFTAVMCALGWYVHTHRATEPLPPNQVTVTRYTVECGSGQDGRFWAAVPALPGVLAHGNNEEEVKARVSALALHTLAERLESRETRAHGFIFHIGS